VVYKAIEIKHQLHRGCYCISHAVMKLMPVFWSTSGCLHTFIEAEGKFCFKVCMSYLLRSYRSIPLSSPAAASGTKLTTDHWHCLAAVAPHCDASHRPSWLQPRQHHPPQPSVAAAARAALRPLSLRPMLLQWTCSSWLVGPTPMWLWCLACTALMTTPARWHRVWQQHWEVSTGPV